MINQIEHNEVKSSQISENEVVGSKDSSGTIIHIRSITKFALIPSLFWIKAEFRCLPAIHLRIIIKYFTWNLRFYLINAVYLIEAELKTFNSIHQIENNRIWLNRKLFKYFSIFTLLHSLIEFHQTNWMVMNLVWLHSINWIPVNLVLLSSIRRINIWLILLWLLPWLNPNWTCRIY